MNVLNKTKEQQTIELLTKEIEALRSQLARYQIDKTFGIFTRNALEDIWEEIDKKELAIAYIDIDDLKKHNSTDGMDAVNTKIKRAVSKAFSQVRGSERFNKAIGRYYSGDEMVIICPLAEISFPCQRVMDSLKEDGMSATITITPYKGEKTLTEAVKYVNDENQKCKLIGKGQIYLV